MSEQLHLPLPQRETLAAEDFMITASNRDAATWLLKLDPSSWPSHCLILVGPHGCGKTHLLTAWAEKTGARKLEIGEDVFSEILGDDTQTTQTNPPPPKGGGVRGGGYLDNADAIAGHPEHEEWLQHLYNATKAAGMPLLLTAKTPPAAWSLTLPDIASRLKSCATVEISEPDDDLLRAMLIKQFSDRQLLVETDVIDYLIPRLERTAAAIREAVTLLDKKALEQRRKITIPFIQECMT